MEVVQLNTDSPLKNFTYLIINKEQKSCYVIDPFDSNQILQFLDSHNLNLTSIINTHEHWDHTCGNEGLIPRLKESVLCHPNSRRKIPTSTKELQLGSRVSIGKGWMQILDTPGHTMGHVSLLCGFLDNPEFILTGDTLFNAGVGNCKNGGDPEVLYQTIQKNFSTLPDSVKLYPGHDYWENNLKFTISIHDNNPLANQLLNEYKNHLSQGKNLVSNLGLERKISLFFQLSNNDLKQKLNLSKSSTEKDVFIQLRKLRDSW